MHINACDWVLIYIKIDIFILICINVYALKRAKPLNLINYFALALVMVVQEQIHVLFIFYEALMCLDDFINNDVTLELKMPPKSIQWLIGKFKTI